MAPEAQKKRLGLRTLHFPSAPALAGWASVAGPKEGKGPLGELFDEVSDDNLLGQSSFEKAEMRMMERAVRLATEKAGLKLEDIDVIVGGDLLNQIISVNFAARNLDRPFLGLFGACSTWCEGLLVAGALVDGGYAKRVAVAVSSHHETAERQYRFPTEFANQRDPTAQWTATGAAAVVLVAQGSGEEAVRGPRLRSATIGRVMDLGVKNPFDMGSAMAPAAFDTIAGHIEDSKIDLTEYDRIVTGDLAQTGSDMLLTLSENNPDRMEVNQLKQRHEDCGIVLYGKEDKQVMSGGSGTACSALVFTAHYIPLLERGELNNMLLVATGALLSPTSYQQGESIPCIAHATSWTGVS